MSNPFRSHYVPFSETGKFSKIILDYTSHPENLENFFEHAVNIEGIKNSILQREKFNNNRSLLTEQLQVQYENIEDSERVNANIHALSLENTFTVCTAHQPNIFTGHLYFIYKILHTIKLTDELKKQLPQYNFVPVFFMGSEDADLQELNFVIVDGKRYEWTTQQKGAVGRMKVDDQLLRLIDEIAGRLSIEKYGNDIISLLKKSFQKDRSVEQSTFMLVHHLFKSFGLVVFLPDNAALKRAMLPVFEEDIFDNTSSAMVSTSAEKLSAQYKVQAHPRDINLFYLKDDIRNRIVPFKDNFTVNDTNLVFSKDEIREELDNFPERFSPNVILRGLYQETILPNIAFIGGGGEIAYWLELKELFQHYKVPFPMLIVRNSFMIIEKKYQLLQQKLHLNVHDLFKTETTLLNEIVAKQTTHRLTLDAEKLQMQNLYDSVKKTAVDIDPTLEAHVASLQTKHLNKLIALEKKMLRAEKRKFEDQKNQLVKLFKALFPEGDLQERTENFMLFYAKSGSNFFDMLYEKSLLLEQQFCIIEEYQ